MTAHTKEPWFAGKNTSTGTWVLAPRKQFQVAAELISNWQNPDAPHGIAQLRGDSNERKANRDRIVACVNALAGMDPAGVPGLLATAKDSLAVMDKLSEYSGGGSDGAIQAQLRKAIADVEGKE